jgi:hypothetical protein
MIWSSFASGRELTCEYITFSNVLWPTFNQCVISSADLSETFKTEEHSFTGTPEQKSAVSVVYFKEPTQIDFLPKEMLKDFPQLNGIRIIGCQTFKTVKEDFFSEHFGAIQYLDLYRNQIETIEANAFQHLPKLKWISLANNQLRSLPQQIFKYNPELIMIHPYSNKINSITVDFFKNLNKLQNVHFGDNQCSNKDFGCTSGSCSVTQEELQSDLSTCFKNCRDDSECAANSGNSFDNLNSEEIESNTNKFEKISQNFKTMKEDVKVQQETIETLGNNLTLLIENHDSEMKGVTQDVKCLLVQSNAECQSDSKVINSELESLKQELAELKTTLKENKDCSDDAANLEAKLKEIFKREFKDFITKLN